MSQIQTGHKAFDQAANGSSGYVGTGNVISRNQYSCHLRGWSETQCNGFTFAPGQLQAADLETVKANYPDVYRLLANFLKKPDNHFRNHSGWLYVIRHFNKGRPVIHGVILTDEAHQHLASFSREQVGVGRAQPKSHAVMVAMTRLLVA